MLVLLSLFVLFGAMAGAAVGRFSGRGYAVAFVPFAATAIWALLNTGRAFTATVVQHHTWVSVLGLDLAFRFDPLAWIMTLVVSGVGAAIVIYCAFYFPPNAAGRARFAATFTFFGGSMLGLVWSNHALMIYTFWELTSVFSFLLIGHHYRSRAARAAARQAFVVTTFGSLAMFGGFMILGAGPGGSFQVDQLVARGAEGTLLQGHPGTLNVALVLVIIGILTKSAMLPFHFWLPAAMAAPTPVSAFLHAATLVKAGVYLALRFTPGFADVPVWSSLLTIFGAATLLVGGWLAIRQTDLKRVLAYGTVSQLGLITALAGYGNRATLLAALTLVLAHGTFKSCLFLTTGTVEKITGSRDIRELSGVGRTHPVLATIGGLAAASMAGFPLTLGYLGKEAGIHNLLHQGAAGVILLAGIAAGSVLTAAYSLRWWFGAFGGKELPGHRLASLLSEKEAPVGSYPAAALIAVPGFLAAITVSGGFFPGSVNALTGPHADTQLEGYLATSNEAGHLALWSGLMPALITALILTGGYACFHWRGKVIRFAKKTALPETFRAANLYRVIMRNLEAVAGRVTSFTQSGSLPLDISIISTVFAIAVGGALCYALPTIKWGPVRLFDSFLQAIAIAILAGATIVVVRARRRMKAVLGLGAMGVGMATLWAVHGAPDLALTQLVVEAFTIVVFVLVLRFLPTHFTDRPLRSSRWLRLIISVVAGVVTSGGVLLAAASRKENPVSELLPDEVLQFGYGHNIVNVILVDVRAWDTVGELSVLLIAVTGVTALIFRSGLISRLTVSAPSLRSSVAKAASRTSTNSRWLAGASALEEDRRSLMLEVAARILYPTLLVASVWLLLVGHNSPGGGFAGGMLAASALSIRYLAGGHYELTLAAPFSPGAILGLGLTIAAAAGLAPVLAGGAPFQTLPVDILVGPLGTVHFTTAMGLDIGVYLVVLGLAVDILGALGAALDHDEEQGVQLVSSRKGKTK